MGAYSFKFCIVCIMCLLYYILCATGEVDLPEFEGAAELPVEGDLGADDLGGE